MKWISAKNFNTAVVIFFQLWIGHQTNKLSSFRNCMFPCKNVMVCLGNYINSINIKRNEVLLLNSFSSGIWCTTSHFHLLEPYKIPGKERWQSIYNWCYFSNWSNMVKLIIHNQPQNSFWFKRCNAPCWSITAKRPFMRRIVSAGLQNLKLQWEIYK